MAWNPNVPTVTNRVQNDLNAIRENFQHLDQLAELVDELQTVSELAPIANDLQAVSGLAPVAGELQAVGELAPYAQALLSSRIVEMGSNSNGEYVRWENGLQVCWHQSLTERITNTGLGSLYRSDFEEWWFPAAFVGDPVVMIRARRNPPPGATGENRSNIGIHAAGGVSSTRVTGIAVVGVNTTSGGYLSWFAIGRWK